MSMKTLADAELLLKESEHSANELRSRDFREVVQAHINGLREIIKALHRLYN